MPENEFEKQVKDRLDSLNLEPSAAVWQQVEFRIRKDKRRRWFIWIPLLAAGIGAGIWLMPAAEKGNLTNKSTLKQNADGGTSVAAKPAGQQLQSANANTEHQIEPAPTTAIRNSSGETQQKGSRAENFVAQNRPRNTKAGHSATPISQTESPVKSTEPTEENNEEQISQSSSANAIGNENTAADEKIPGADSSNLEKKNTDPAIAKTEENKTAAPVKKKAGRVWSFGIQAGVGISAQSAGVFGEMHSYNNDLSAVGGGPSGLYYSTQNKEPLKSALAFSFGGYAERRLNKSLSIELGLMYSQYGSSIKAGKTVNNTSYITLSNSRYLSISNYFPAQGANSQGNNSFSYRNRYHYLELPVNLNIRLNPSGKTAFRWELGLSPAYMMASNALHYDEQQNIYFHDNSYFNKFQLGFNTALAVRVFGKSKHPLWIGPEYRSFFTNLTNQKNTNGNHLYYGGLKAAFKLR